MKKYNNRLRDLREDKDLTQKEIAETFFLQVTQYRRYENGETDLPLEWAKRFARFYNVSLDYISGLIPTPKPLYTSASEPKSVKITNKGDNNKFNIKQ